MLSSTVRARLGWVRLYTSTQDAGLVCHRCGISRPTLRNVPAEGQVPAQTFTQSYTYDALNRLETAGEVNGSGTSWS